MKKSIRILCASATALFVLFGTPHLTPANSVAHAEVQARQITVNGTGTVTVDPDVVYVQFGVETTGKTASEAMNRNATIFASVKDALRKAGIAEKDIQTVQFSTFPEYDYNDKQGPKLTGYRVQNIVRVTYRDLKNVGSLLDQLSAAGINRVDSLTFGSEKMDQYTATALTRAVQDARAKADVLAQAAGVKVKEVISISQLGTSQPPVVYMQKMAAEAAPSATSAVYAGQLQVSASVDVVFGF